MSTTSQIDIHIPPKPATEVCMRVGDTEITTHEVFKEAQYHPSASWEQAIAQAKRALVVRQLLLAEVRRRQPQLAQQPISEIVEQELIASLTETEVPVPEIDDGACRSFYQQNPSRFAGPELFDPSHILVPFAADGTEQQAHAKAVDLLEQLERDPGAFERLARQHSACPSGKSGGRLGQVTRGETVPEFERALDALRPGELAEQPVRTRHGFHLIWLHHRAERTTLPFEAVREKIRIYLRDKQWRQQLAAFIRDLADGTEIVGFDLDAPDPEPPAKRESSELSARATAAEPARTARGLRRLPVLN